MPFIISRGYAEVQILKSRGYGNGHYTFSYIYILGVFTEKPYSKPLERNVVYIPVITLSHATSHDFK